MSQSQTAVLRHEAKTDKKPTKHKSNKRMLSTLQHGFYLYIIYYGKPLTFKMLHFANLKDFQTGLRKVREKSTECHSHKQQPFQDTKRKRKLTKPNTRESNKRTLSTKVSSPFLKRGRTLIYYHMTNVKTHDLLPWG